MHNSEPVAFSVLMEMRMRLKILMSLAAVVISLAAIVVYAQPEKDVIGTWKMDVSRSEFTGSHGAPSDVVIRFEREDGSLRETIKVVNAAGESNRTINYSLDGAEMVNGSGDERIKTKVVRRADAIILEWIDDGGTFTRTLKLSNDRRILSIKAHDASADGKIDDLIVLERQ
jgi:hypothetical protein